MRYYLRDLDEFGVRVFKIDGSVTPKGDFVGSWDVFRWNDGGWLRLEGNAAVRVIDRTMTSTDFNEITREEAMGYTGGVE